MKTIGFAVCGSFCTFEKVFKEAEHLTTLGYSLVPIMSENAYNLDTRFGSAAFWREKFHAMTDRKIIHTLQDAEPIGPKKLLDALIIAPCTGNTLAKLANGITDTPVTMAAKSTLRCDLPLVIALATNDALSANLANIAVMRNRKNVHFVPMGMDDPANKPHSLVADFERLSEVLRAL